MQTCRLAGLIYLPLFLQRAKTSDRHLIYSWGCEGQGNQAVLHQSWIQQLKIFAFQRGMAAVFVAGENPGDRMGSEVQILYPGLQLGFW